MLPKYFAWLIGGAIAVPTDHRWSSRDAKRLIIDTDMIDFVRMVMFRWKNAEAYCHAQVDDPVAIGLANVFSIRREAQIFGIISSTRTPVREPAVCVDNLTQASSVDMCHQR